VYVIDVVLMGTNTVTAIFSRMTVRSLAHASHFCFEDGGGELLRNLGRYELENELHHHAQLEYINAFLCMNSFGGNCNVSLKVFCEMTEDKRQNSVSIFPTN
jgi:hypothetical protein